MNPVLKTQDGQRFLKRFLKEKGVSSKESLTESELDELERRLIRFHANQQVKAWNKADLRMVGQRTTDDY